jgi:hypothetical protein
MTRDTAEKVATVTIGAAAVALAYVVVKTPPLRRLAAGLAFTALTGAVPAWLSRELRAAWLASDVQGHSTVTVTGVKKLPF